MSRKVRIVGAGISGLSLAYRLSKSRPDLDIRLLEASDRAGGVLQTHSQDGFLVEAGPDCFISEKPAGVRLAEELGLKSELIGTDKRHRKAFIIKNSKLYPVPQGFYLMAPAALLPFLRSPLVSWKGKLRMLMEPFISPPPPMEDEALASFVERRLGREVLERVAQPMIAGIYTADPKELSLRATFPAFLEMEQKHGSILRGLRHRPKAKDWGTSGPRYSLFVSFRHGMSTLTKALEERVKPLLRLDTRVESIRHKGPFRWEVTANGATEEVDFVCLTLPAPASGRLIQEGAPELSSLLTGIEYASSATVSLAYRREQIRHPLNAMGFVIPATEKRTLNSCSFSSQKFEGRAPEGYVLLRGFTGGKMDAHVYAMPDDELIAGVKRDLADLLGIEGEPLFARLARWEKSMAQYAVGHVGRVKRIDEEAAKFPGLFLGGNGYTGVGVPDVIARSERIASNLPAILALQAGHSPASVNP